MISRLIVLAGVFYLAGPRIMDFYNEVTNEG